MKLKFSTVAFVLLLTIQSALFVNGQDARVGAEGTSIPLYQEYDSETGFACFVYERYVFKTAPNEDGGDDINVFKRSRASGHKENCAADEARPLMVYPADDYNFFFGLTDDKFFVDSGTGAGERGLAVVSLTLKKSIYSTSYMSEAKVVGDTLVYDERSDVKGSLKACPEYRKWRKIGGGEGWVRTMRLDLTTLRKTPVGRLKCVYLE